MPNIGKVNLIGAQDEVIFLEFSTREIAALGISQQDVVNTLQAQNAITPSGVIEAGPERISMRVDWTVHVGGEPARLNLRINDRFFRLSDIATITPRLRRSAAEAVPIQRPARHRPCHRHEDRREPAGVRRGA